jgi:hypothetical protein
VRVVDQLQSSGTRRDHARRRQVDTARTVRHSGLLAFRSVEASGLRRVTAPTVQPKRADSPKKCPNTSSPRGPDRQVLGILTRRARRGRHRPVRARLLTCTTMTDLGGLVRAERRCSVLSFGAKILAHVASGRTRPSTSIARRQPGRPASVSDRLCSSSSTDMGRNQSRTVRWRSSRRSSNWRRRWPFAPDGCGKPNRQRFGSSTP